MGALSATASWAADDDVLLKNAVEAVIKMGEGGSFHIKNIGKYPIFVNGKEVPCNKRINLISDALLEIRGMKFIFHVNSDAIRQHIVHARRGSSQGKHTAFDWDQNP